MRRSQSSLTAAGIAIMRAVESEKPEGKRICYDPFARAFVPGWFYAFTKFFINTGYAEMRGPGVMGFIVARDRYIDDVLSGFLDNGIHQLVILGAGFDSRAYRFKKIKQNIKVIEVDHPATQTDKIEKVIKLFGSQPAFVTYVPVDFNTQNLTQCLLASSYDRHLKTLFIWQGVSMYLTPEAVDDTLRFVVNNSTPGSAIVFDYIHQKALDESEKHNEVTNMRRYRFMTGEGLTFGLEESQLEMFLSVRGFRKFDTIDSNGLKNTYFSGVNSVRKVASGYGIVVAEV
jgi:methyltransferase (TIGR00027 family)